jgi:hypothetical protein
MVFRLFSGCKQGRPYRSLKKEKEPDQGGRGIRYFISAKQAGQLAQSDSGSKIGIFQNITELG